MLTWYESYSKRNIARYFRSDSPLLFTCNTNVEERNSSLGRCDGSTEIASCSTGGSNVLETTYFLGKMTREILGMSYKTLLSIGRVWQGKFSTTKLLLQKLQLFINEQCYCSWPKKSKCRVCLDKREGKINCFLWYNYKSLKNYNFTFVAFYWQKKNDVLFIYRLQLYIDVRYWFYRRTFFETFFDQRSHSWAHSHNEKIHYQTGDINRLLTIAVQKTLGKSRTIACYEKQQ